MREHPNDIGFIAAGTNAAEVARRFLHPELEGQHAGGSALPTLVGVQPVIPSAIDWVTQEEKDRLAAEARARAITAAAVTAAAEAEAHARLERARQITRQIGIVVFQSYLFVNLLFGMSQIAYWVDAASKSANVIINYAICLAEIFRCLANSLTTTVLLVMAWRRRPRALDAAIAFLLLRVAIALSLAAYYESLRRTPLSYLETWQPSAIAAAFWIPCLLSFREHWKSWSASKISKPLSDKAVTCDQIPQAAPVRISWQVVTLLCVAMICGTAFAIAWFCFRR